MTPLKNTTSVFLLALACFAFLPKVQAGLSGSPPPDGCYPNFTTAEGCNALHSLTTGEANTGVGWRSLFTNTIGSFNTGIGAGALVLNTGDSNTAVGAAALLLNTTGTENTATGTGALLSNTTANRNTADGAFALSSNTIGVDNTATGIQALFSNNANGNTADGAFALFSNTTGSDNTAIGDVALSANTTGVNNTAIGTAALSSETTATANTATGYEALFSNITGSANTANGNEALFSNTTGGDPITGGNTATGFFALFNNTTGSDNIALGSGAGINVTTADHTICIGAAGANVGNSCYIGQIFDSTSTGGTAVFVNGDGQLGTMTSSERFKQEIKPMGKASDMILALKPVTFRYKKEIDPKRTSQFGLVAEDVEKVNPDLVVRDKEGRPYSVRYDQVNAMLLNEFLKEHRKVEQMQKQIDALTAGLQKVSAQLELNKPAPQTALSSQ